MPKILNQDYHSIHGEFAAIDMIFDGHEFIPDNDLLLGMTKYAWQRALKMAAGIVHNLKAKAVTIHTI